MGVLNIFFSQCTVADAWALLGMGAWVRNSNLMCARYTYYTYTIS